MILFELDHFGSIIAVATATLKLPNRRRIVFSDGRMAASVEAMQANPKMHAHFPRIAALAAFDGFAGDVTYAHQA
jgi:hypothetical protein